MTAAGTGWVASASSAGLATAGALLSATLILALRPWLLRYALARPSARGLHRTPTPQGGGIAVLLACAATAACGAWLFASGPDLAVMVGILAAAAGLALVGFVDDIRPLPPMPRLLLQLAIMTVGVALLPAGTQVFPFLPPWCEAVILVLAGTWFINLTNFMDGMDWITVTDAVPVTAALTMFWAAGDLPMPAGLLALGLLGGLLGYAPFNKPVARLFLGDVGSLPIGFLLAYCLFSLAGNGGGGPGALVAAILLPLYPIADSGITLAWRLRRGEKVWEPHRSHYYQTAIIRGWSVWQVLSRVLAVNLVLTLLAWTSLRSGVGLAAGALISGAALVAATLVGLSRQPKTRVEH